MVDVFWAVTANVAIENVPLACPDAIFIDAGTVATLVELLDSVTVTPAEPAGPLRVMVPVEGLPPVTDVGFSLRETIAKGVTVREAVSFVPANSAESDAVIASLT
jgi:hypothetical protein